MAHNPLLGNRISLISKKDIRYEGTLYSINEADATVALANVKSYGTEGREVSSGGTFIPPMTDVFSYLVFRGCDIKDLHVHDNATTTTAAAAATPPQQQQPPEPSKASPITADAKPTITTTTTTTSKVESKSKRENAHEEQPLSTTSPSNNQSLIPSNATTTTVTKVSPSTTHTDSNAADAKAITSSKTTSTSNRTSSTSTTTASKVTPTTAAVGTGESLLNRKVRGGTTTATSTTATPNLDSKNQSSLQDEQEFDFQSSATKFEKETTEEESNPKLHYTKDNFFDSISCDALDKQAGRTSDPRLRGAAERQLNTETFGAASLAGYNNQRRGTNTKNSSSWRRGGGGGRGRGRGRGNRNPNDNNNKPRHYNNSNHNKKSTPKPTSSRVSPE